MNKQSDDRCDLQLPCRLLFPNLWPASLDGLTANLHKSGVIVACRLKPGRELPSLGEPASVDIELPRSQDFPQKFIRCDTTLLRVEELGPDDFHFAMQITNVDFEDISTGTVKLRELDPESCNYLM